MYLPFNQHKQQLNRTPHKQPHHYQQLRKGIFLRVSNTLNQQIKHIIKHLDQKCLQLQNMIIEEQCLVESQLFEGHRPDSQPNLSPVVNFLLQHKLKQATTQIDKLFTRIIAPTVESIAQKYTKTLQSVEQLVSGLNINGLASNCSQHTNNTASHHDQSQREQQTSKKSATKNRQSREQLQHLFIEKFSLNQHLNGFHCEDCSNWQGNAQNTNSKHNIMQLINSCRSQCGDSNRLSLCHKPTLLQRSLGEHRLPLDKHRRPSGRQNMHFVDVNQIKSAQLSFIHPKQQQIVQQIVDARKCLQLQPSSSGQISTNDNLNGTQIQTIKQSIQLQLRQLYMKLYNLGTYSCIYHRVNYCLQTGLFQQQFYRPGQQSLSTLERTSLYKPDKQQLFKATKTLKFIQFKLQAQGFTPSNFRNNVQSSTFQFRSKVLTHKQKINQAKNKKEQSQQKQQHHQEQSKQTDNKQVQPIIQQQDHHKVFVAFFDHTQNKIMDDLERIQLKQQQKFFQFGIGDAMQLQDEVRQINQQHKNVNSQDKCYFSIKILNLQNKLYIQSINQAKLTKLNPLWKYFGCRLIQNQRFKNGIKQTTTHVQMYGIIIAQNPKKDGDQSKPSENILQQSKLQQQQKQQLFLTAQLPPKLTNKTLKPFFRFKGFQCKISVRQQQRVE